MAGFNQLPRNVAHLLLAVFFIGFLVGCSSDEGPDTLVQDVGTDTSIDSGIDDEDSTYVDVESHDVDVGDGPEPQAQWSDCDCPNPEEKCTSVGYCGLPDEACGPDTDGECPDGYTCQRPYASTTHPVFVCVCVGDDEKCTPACERQEDCPLNFHSCSYQDGVCRWNAGGHSSCRSSFECPEGYYCASEHNSRCQPTGDRDIGEDCQSDPECQTGICNQSTGLCDEQCLSDGDCPEDAYCINYGGDWSDNGCSPHLNCQVSCTPPKRCGGDKCLPQACKTTADCDVGDCQRDLQTPGSRLPTCIEHQDSEVERYCKPDERFSPSGHCYIPGPCWDDTHCDEPYTCNGNCRREIDLNQEDM